MDENEDYDSDSTVLISDLSKNPEKIARKRRKLDATLRRVSQTHIHASDAENMVPNAPSGAVSRDGKRKRYNDKDTEQWRIHKFLGMCEPATNNNVNDTLSEDLKVKKELLKQEHDYSRIDEDGNDDNDEEGNKDCVVISDDSDDDCTVVNNELNGQGENNKNANPTISVLTPSAINTRRATLDSFESNESASNKDSVKSTKTNKVNPKITVLKPSAINARRATFNCFQINDTTGKNVDKSVIKRVDFSSNENKDKESNDNKMHATANKHVVETNGLLVHMRTSEHPPKLTTTDQNEISTKMKSSGVIEGKAGDLQIRRISSSSKNIDENAAVIKIVKQNETINSSSVIHSTTEVLNRNLHKNSSVQDKVDVSAVNTNDPNTIHAGHDKTTKINDICEDANKNNVTNDISYVSKSEDTGNHFEDHTTNLDKRPVDIDVVDGSKKGNEHSPVVNKPTDYKQVTVDKNALMRSSAVFNNTNSVENPILHNLKNIIKDKIIHQIEDSGVSKESDKANEQLPNVKKSDDAERVETNIPTFNSDASCSNVAINTSSSENPVIEILKNIITGNEIQQTETNKNKKSDEKVNEVNNDQSPRRLDRDHVINSNIIVEADNRKNMRYDMPYTENIIHGSTEFLICFFEYVIEYLEIIFQDAKKVRLLRASPDTLITEIKHVLHDAKKHGASDIQYACPKCSQVSVYSPEAVYQIRNDNNAMLANNTIKCNLCLGLQLLHRTKKQIYSQNIKRNKNRDEINAAPLRRQDNIFNRPLGQNNNVASDQNISAHELNASTSTLNVTATKDNTVTEKAATLTNNISIKPNENLNKQRTSSSIENCGQSDPIAHNKNDVTNSGEKKSYKRKVDDNGSSTDPKRVRTDKNTQDNNSGVITKKNTNQTELISTTALPSSLLNKPSTSNNSVNKMISDNSNESGSKNKNKTGSGDENDANKYKMNSKAILTKALERVTNLKDSHNNSEDKLATQVAEASENLIQTEKDDDTKIADPQHECPVCTCMFSSPASLLSHMKSNHNWNNITEKGNEFTCLLCDVHLTETNYNVHMKKHYTDGNSEDVGSDNTMSVSSNCRNINIANAQEQNKAQIVTSSGGKQYECKICKKVLYSLVAAKKHRKLVHGHLDLKNVKLYNITWRKAGLKRTSADIQSSTSVENTTRENKNPTLGNEEEATNQGSGSVGSNDMIGREKNVQTKTNEVAAQRNDDVMKSNDYEQNCNIGTDQINVSQNFYENYDERAKTNEKRQRKASQNGNIIEEVKQTNATKSIEKTVYKCLICKRMFTDYGSRKHREEKHPDFINKHLFDKITITDVAQTDKGKSSDGETREKSKTHKDDQYEINLINAFLGELEDEDDNKSNSSTIDNIQDTTKTDKTTKLHKTFQNVYNNGNEEQAPKTRVNDILQTNAEIISESNKHEINAKKGVAVGAESSSQAKEHGTIKWNEKDDINKDSTKDPNKKRNSVDSSSENTNVDETNKLPDTDISQNGDDKVNSEAEDKINPEQKKPKRIFPTALKRNPSLANCYNCRTNLGVNDIINHVCMKSMSTLYNCFSCGVNIQRDDTHKCENENNFCIENIQITKVETVKELYVFKCEECNTATDVYDDIIRHCQNHYNNIEQTTAFCKTCQLFYNTGYFESHEHLHGNEIKIINYSYKSLFSNWDKIFDNIPRDIANEMQLRSIYSSHSVKMMVKEEGPWQYSLYECNKCETCVPPGKLDQHCQKQCCFVAYPCSQCNKLFPSSPMCTNHELDHRATKQFKIIEFNSKKDERFNLKLFEARKLEIESRTPIADIYKCQCDVCFISNEIFRKHFVSCNMESDKGVICRRCAVPRHFEASEHENHLRLHHSSVAYRFRVNRILIQQEVEPFDIFNPENGLEWKAERRSSLNVSSSEDDIKKKLLKEENNERTV